MFVKLPKRPELSASLAAKIRPLASASSRQIPLDEPWSSLLPGSSLRRGATLNVTAPPGVGGLTTAYSLLTGATAAGHWCAVVGVDDPGVVAMAELGIDLRRVLFGPRPRGAWAESSSDLFDGVDVVVVRVPSRAPHAAARTLMARARERGVALIVLTESRAPWPLPVDLTIEIVSSSWEGSSRLTTRQARARVSGRGVAGLAREYLLDLPGVAGRVATAS